MRLSKDTWRCYNCYHSTKVYHVERTPESQVRLEQKRGLDDYRETCIECRREDAERYSPDFRHLDIPALLCRAEKGRSKGCYNLARIHYNNTLGRVRSARCGRTETAQWHYADEPEKTLCHACHKGLYRAYCLMNLH